MSFTPRTELAYVIDSDAVAKLRRLVVLVLSEAVLVIVIVLVIEPSNDDCEYDYDYEHEHEHEHDECAQCGAARRTGGSRWRIA